MIVLSSVNIEMSKYVKFEYTIAYEYLKWCVYIDSTYQNEGLGSRNQGVSTDNQSGNLLIEFICIMTHFQREVSET